MRPTPRARNSDRMWLKLAKLSRSRRRRVWFTKMNSPDTRSSSSPSLRRRAPRDCVVSRRAPSAPRRSRPGYSLIARSAPYAVKNELSPGAADVRVAPTSLGGPRPSAARRRSVTSSAPARRAARGHGVAHDDVLLAAGLAQRSDALAPFRCGLAPWRRRRESRGPRAGRTALAIQHPVEQRDAGIAAQRPVRLEERHLLGEVGVADALPLHDRLDPRERGPMRARGDRARGRDADLAIGVLDGALEHLQRARRPDLANACTAAAPRGVGSLSSLLRARTAACVLSDPARRIASSETSRFGDGSAERAPTCFRRRAGPPPPRAPAADGRSTMCLSH